jgi:hypothetical protein|tara:strand:+ start:46 stop:282 length:237 start_codon:yes stop_codon:yes gene_type:complete
MSNFVEGYKNAVEEYSSNKFSLAEALESFSIDPPESDYQLGFLEAVRSLHKFGVPTYAVDNVVYVGWPHIDRETGDES